MRGTLAGVSATSREGTGLTVRFGHFLRYRDGEPESETENMKGRLR